MHHRVEGKMGAPGKARLRQEEIISRGRRHRRHSDALSASSLGDGLAEAVIRHIRLGAGVRRQDGKVSRSTVATSSERLCGR